MGHGSVTIARACIAFDSHHDDISERTRLLEQTNVTRMQQVESATREYNTLAVAFPLAASENQFILRNYAAQTFPLPTHYDAWLQTHHSNMRLRMAGPKR